MINDYNLFQKSKFLCKLGMQPRYNFFEKKRIIIIKILNELINI